MPDHADYTEEQLAYFQELIEGRASVSWKAWWKQNEAVLKEQLKRPEYLRLKFGLVEYAHQILVLNGIHAEWGPAARRESYYANLHESVLDEKGRPLEPFRRKSYGGACGDCMDGRPEAARAKLASIISKLEKRSALEAKDELESMQFDGERMVTSGVDAEFGKLLLEAVASYGYGDDLTDYAVDRAERILQDA